MGNVIYTDQVVCYDSLEACKSHCKAGECVFADVCNGMASKFTCFLFDYRFFTWLIFGCFLLVLLVCSSLVACYACRAIQASLRWQTSHSPNREVVLNHSGPIRDIHPTAGGMVPKRTYNTRH